MNHEAYLLQFFSSHGYGQSIKFEKKTGGCSLSIKCINGLKCENYHIGIEEEEWNILEQMIYEFNFWTEEDFRIKRGVADGYGYFLEGNRPKAEKCNKKTYKLVCRGSPEYDKMGALCEYIREYEDLLAFRYKQRE